MTPQLEKMIADAHKLSVREKLELLQVLSADLQNTHFFIEETTRFWNPRTPDQILATQTAPVIMDLHVLAADFWPEDETADEINEFVTTQRQNARLQDA